MKDKYSDSLYDCGNFIVRYDSSKVGESEVQAFLSCPDHFVNTGHKINSAWKNKATDKTQIQIGDKFFFAKRYNYLGGIHRIKNLFRKSKAMKAWYAGWIFLRHGISTPQPVICIEERHFRFLGRSYLLFEYIHDAQNLLDAWSAIDEQKQRLFLSLAGTAIGHMHHAGLLHGDLNWRNILIQDGITQKCYLVDLDGYHFSKRLGKTMAMRDLDHFYRDLKRNNAPESYRDLFIKSWQKAANL